MRKNRVVIAGGGPVGLVAAARLVAGGVPVLVLEADAELSQELRGSTFHPATLDMLDGLGATRPLIEQGLIAPKVQYRTRREGLIAEFDFGLIGDVVRHPFRLQAEQFKLVRILHDRLVGEPGFEMRFGCRVTGARQDASGVEIDVDLGGGRSETIAADWLIGADGAHSAVRRAFGLSFEGFTWPERFLVVSTAFDFASVIPGLAPVSYVADPEEWHVLLRVPDLWRVLVPIAPDLDDAQAMSDDYALGCLGRVYDRPGGYAIAHKTLYRVHQRIAESFRRGRVFLIGDAAHINNPLGGMGLNGGVHDAFNLTGKLIDVWQGRAPEALLDRFDRQRRGVVAEHVEKRSIQNKRDLEARGADAEAGYKARMRDMAADPGKAYRHLLDISMVSSLRRAAEIA